MGRRVRGGRDKCSGKHIPLTEENVRTATYYCGLEGHAAELLANNLGVQEPELWTTHARWFRGFETDEYSQDIHIDGDCLGVTKTNELPEGFRALNIWILLSPTITQPLALIKKDGSVVYNPRQTRGSFIVFDYTCVPHTALRYMFMNRNADGERRLSVDFRFMGKME